MRWKKLGRIFAPDPNYDWMITHSAVPIADRIGENLYRIYFSGRDRENRSQTGFIEIDIHNPHKILRISEAPVLKFGPPGTFDDSGAMGSWLVNYEDKKYLYYIGWNRRVTVPFHNSLGLAISEDGGNIFYKYSDGPIMDRGIYDPAFATNPCVLIENHLWRMWYLSCIGWEKMGDGTFRHRYHIKYAESRDGIKWERKGIICIDFKSNEEYAISRPCVIKDKNLYRMWYSYRGKSYRIGYAESEDGIHWVRKDELVGIEVSESGWDSEMIEYPFVFDHNGDRYMLYNGNGYGKSGFGLAVLVEE